MNTYVAVLILLLTISSLVISYLLNVIDLCKRDIEYFEKESIRGWNNYHETRKKLETTEAERDRYSLLIDSMEDKQ